MPHLVHRPSANASVMPHASSPANPVLLRADDLHLSYGGQALFAGLSFTIHPGLNLLQGGEGRGKTSLLRMLSGSLQPQRGRLDFGARAAPIQVYYECPEAAAHDACPAQDWLAERRPRFPAWQAALEAELILSLGLEEHLGKPMFMLSTGSRRKIGLVAAAACGAELTLLDQPYSALDARSSRVLSDLLLAASQQQARAWLLADYGMPPALTTVRLQSLIDLGD
ncbi:ABC transporter [Paucibacter sp. KBW04]|nr:ABC transporter [Paucibacter sp. KBW04]